jgi:hypothetical protein
MRPGPPGPGQQSGAMGRGQSADGRAPATSATMARPGQATTPTGGGRGALSPSAGRGLSPSSAPAAGRGVQGVPPNVAGRGSPVSVVHPSHALELAPPCASCSCLQIERACALPAPCDMARLGDLASRHTGSKDKCKGRGHQAAGTRMRSPTWRPARWPEAWQPPPGRHPQVGHAWRRQVRQCRGKWGAAQCLRRAAQAEPCRRRRGAGWRRAVLPCRGSQGAGSRRCRRHRRRRDPAVWGNRRLPQRGKQLQRSPGGARRRQAASPRPLLPCSSNRAPRLRPHSIPMRLPGAAACHTRRPVPRQLRGVAHRPRRPIAGMLPPRSAPTLLLQVSR